MPRPRKSDVGHPLRTAALLAAAAFAVAAPSAPARAELVVDLGPPVIAGNVAGLDVNFTFNAAPADTLELFQLSVIGSDPSLTANGTDFSRFEFALEPDLASDWNGFPTSIGEFGYILYFPNDIINGPFLSPGTRKIGTLTVNLAGLPVNVAEVIVTLAGNDPDFPTNAAGTLGGDFDFTPLVFNQPGGVAIPVPASGGSGVPEPATTSLALVVLAACAARPRTRSWFGSRFGARSRRGPG